MFASIPSVSTRLQFLRQCLAAGLLAVAALSASGATPPVKPAVVSSEARAQVAQNYGKLPLSFEANQGQTDPQVKFLARGRGYGLYLTDREAVLSLRKPQSDEKTAQPDQLRLSVVGARQGAQPTGAEQLPGTANYFLGNDQSKWHTNLPTYAKVKYSSVYDGIDLVYYGNQGQLEYDFVVAPGADPKSIRVKLAGATHLHLASDGDLEVATAHGKIAFHKPVLYQEVDGQRQTVAGAFRLLAGNTVSFTLGRYDRTRQLVIDPVLVYSTFIGGSAGWSTDIGRGDAANAIAVDLGGNAYMTGTTSSSDFPLSKGALQTGGGLGVSFVLKLNAAGSALIYSTYLGGDLFSGGTRVDAANAIAVDSSGNAYVAGQAWSIEFPTTAGAFQTQNNAAGKGQTNAFVAKINPTGTALVYSTYLGGSGTSSCKAYGDYATGIALDSTGAAYVTGAACSTNFPVKNAYQNNNNATDTYGYNAFVTKLNSTGTALVYSTYLGGSGIPSYVGYGDTAAAIAVNKLGQAFVTGWTYSADFPTTKNAYQKVNKGITSAGYSVNAFITEIGAEAGANSLLASTYLGGSGKDYTKAIALDSAGAVYVTGEANSANFPTTPGVFQPTQPQAPYYEGYSGPSSFATKLTGNLSTLSYSTYLGGATGDLNDVIGEFGTGIAVDSAGNAVVVGTVQAQNFPVTSNAFQDTLHGTIGNDNGFVTKLNPTATALLYSTYIGGSGDGDYENSGDSVSGLALDLNGNAYIAGMTYSLDFPTTPDAYQRLNKAAPVGGTNAFAAKFALASASGAIPTDTTLATSSASTYAGDSVTFTAQVAETLESLMPAGSVSFSVDGKIAATQQLSMGTATYSTSALTVGTHSIVASYVGNSTFSSSESKALAVVVQQKQASPPIFSPAVGTYYSPQSITITDATPGATIYYTINGAAPTTGSTKYTGPITVSETETIKAAAIAAGYSLSAVATGTYTIPPPTATPTFTPAPGTYTVQQRVQIADATSGAVIYYTTDGTTPTTQSTRYYGSILVQKGTTINAIAQAYDYSVSKVATAVYSFTAPPSPTFSPAAGAYYAPQTVTISDTDKAATIYYTTDGTTPTQNSYQYYNPIQVSQTETVKAIAATTPYVQSAAATAVFTINPPPAPTFSPAAGNYTAAENIKILDAAAGATIYYTTDGSTPNYYSNTYNGPIAISKETVTIRAFAATNSTLQSAVASATFTYVPPAGSIETVGGTPGRYGHSGDNGPFLGSLLESTQGIVFDSKGNLFIAEYYNNDVRRVDAVTHVITTYAGNGTAGYSGDKGPAAKAELNQPVGLALDSEGNLYIADSGNSLIRMVSASTGFITTVAGHCVLQSNACGTGSSGNGGAATSALLYNPNGVAVDAAGDIYISDFNNQVIRKVAAKTGIINIYAGTNGEAAYGGDNGPATKAYLAYPEDLALDAAGNLYISDNANGLIRKVTAATGIITTFAGKCIPVPGEGYCGWGYSGNSGQANEAQLDSPRGLAFDKAGNLYIADSFNNVIRKVNAATGVITTVAGNGYGAFAQDSTARAPNKGGFSGDLGPATAAELNNPTGVAIDSSGNLFLADYQNDVVREVVAASAP